jgi:hypothetical protein
MRPGLLPMTLKQSDSSEWVGGTFPRPKKLKFQSSHIKIMLLIFFSNLKSAQKIVYQREKQ